MLERYGVPVFYEQSTLIHDRGRWRIWHPDFTLPSYRNLILEYAGMMDIPQYRQGVRHKQRAYHRNNKPAVFVYPQQIRSANWERKLYERILYTFQQARSYTRGPPKYRRPFSYR